MISGRIAKLDGKPMISVVTRIEVENGVVKDPQYEQRRRDRLDFLISTLTTLQFGEAEVNAYRRIVEDLGYLRRQLLDRMIAAQAIVGDAHLVTLNPQDFRLIPKIELADW